MLKLNFAGRLAICAFVLCVASTPAMARDYAIGALRISHLWSRPTPPGAPTAVGYLTIKNTGDSADRLIGGSTPDATKLEIHQMSMNGGIMTMRPVQGGIAVPAHGSVSLAPEGYHLMFVGPKRQFKIGDHIPASLRFERAGRVDVAFAVEQPSPTAGAMSGMTMPASRPGMH
jgi:hypothetical protein